MLHCLFDTSILEVVEFVTTSQLLVETFLSRNVSIYPYNKFILKDFTKQELIEYHDRDTKVKMDWNVDEVLELAYSDIYCYIHLNESETGNHEITYTLTNKADSDIQLYKSCVLGRHNDMEHFIRDLNNNLDNYCKMGLDIDTFNNIFNMEFEKLTRKHSIKVN